MNIVRVLLLGILSFGLFGNAIADIDSGLIAHYKFDGNANDSSGNGYNGTENGGITYVSGKSGQAASFDGVSDWIYIQDMSHISNDDFTVSIWLKYPDQTGGTNDYSAILIQSTNYQYPYEGATIFVDINTDDVLQFRINAEETLESSTGQLNNNEWKLFSFVKNGSQLSIFINGIIDSSKFISSFNINSTSPIFIGSNHRLQNHQNYEGLLDDLRIYNRALTELEIKELYSINTDTGVCTGTGTNTNECIATYNADGTLNVPCVSVPNAFGGTTIYEADMAIIPLSSPLSFELIDARIK